MMVVSKNLKNRIFKLKSTIQLNFSAQKEG